MHLEIIYSVLIWISVFVFSSRLDVMQQLIVRWLLVYCPVEKIKYRRGDIMDPFSLLIENYDASFLSQTCEN